MRKIVMFNRVSVDGFFAGPNGEIDWHVMDPQVDAAIHQMMAPDTILFGRVTYQMFESFWPHVTDDPGASPGFRALADELNQMTKIVFSTTLESVTWVNSRLMHGDVVGEAQRLKAGTGGDMVIFGSGTIAQQLAATGLIDEHILAITPVLLGAGKPMFKGGEKTVLRLLESSAFPTGNVVQHYAVEN
ncbi:MAG: dihydrofolate reductase [Chloroflexi bacterium]|nr:dihydrofolate reductase [Chloroflexota bacterium]